LRQALLGVLEADRIWGRQSIRNLVPESNAQEDLRKKGMLGLGAMHWQICKRCNNGLSVMRSVICNKCDAGIESNAMADYEQCNAGYESNAQEDLRKKE